jgi:hypothetical protein
MEFLLNFKVFSFRKDFIFLDILSNEIFSFLSCINSRLGFSSLKIYDEIHKQS